MPQMDMSKLPPEQAAKIAEAMKGLTGRSDGHRHENCLTKEDLAKDSFMMPENSKMTCKRTVTTNTKTTFAADIDCTGETTMKGQINLASRSPAATPTRAR